MGAKKHSPPKKGGGTAYRGTGSTADSIAQLSTKCNSIFESLPAHYNAEGTRTDKMANNAVLQSIRGPGLLENNLSLRTSAHTGVAIPRIFKHLGSKTKLFPFNRGAATPVTSVYSSQRHAFLTAPTITLSATSRPKRNESEQLVERIPPDGSP